MDFIPQITKRADMGLLKSLVEQDFGITGGGRWWRSELHSSLVVDVERDRFYFNSRDLRGNAVDYLIGVRGFSRDNAEEFVRKVKLSDSVTIPKEYGVQYRFEKLVSIFHASGKDNREYWYRRGLNDTTIDSYRLGHYDGWNLIPIFFNGMFANFQCRKDTPTKQIRLWYKDADFRPILYNADVLRFVTEAYITEGMVDCILMNQLGFPTVCTTNGALSWNVGWIRYFTNINSITYIADNDAPGVSAAKSVISSLGSSRTKVLRFKDRAEKYGVVDFIRDGGTRDELAELLRNSSVYGFQKGDL